MSLFFVPSNEPFASFVNRMVGYANSSFMSMSALSNQAREAYDGDPLAGTKIRDTNINWDDATEVQKLIQVWFEASGTATQNLEQILKQYPGPKAPWNFSYADWAALGLLKLKQV